MKKHSIISFLIILLPMSALLLFFYFTSNEGVEEILNAPNIYFPNADKKYDYIEDINDYYEIDALNKKIIFHADLMVFEDVEIIDGTIIIEYPDFFSMGKKFYAIDKNDNIHKFDAAKLVKEKMMENNFLIGFSVIITLGTGVFVTMMVLKKMETLKKHRRLSVLVSSTLFTLIFLILSTITDKIFMVFFVFTISWGVYYLNWLAYRKRNGLPLTDQISQRVVITNE